ncbi:actin interacting protein 3-domain-containing protein [Umbelopsis sp. PMI_123]|nr:actin interacting protein 3-domain-containing protein [Umbelopsis sp. PMI_123]
MSTASSLNRRASATSSTMNDIEQSVTKLLLATKQLLEGLTQWSTSQINEQQVYDIFHSLTSQFAQAKRAFESADISMADLMYLPDDLRHCLIIALAEKPSTTALEHHLPTIRDVIIRLLQGLKRKQAQFRDRSESDQVASTSQRASRLANSNRSSTRSSQPPPRSSDRPDMYRKNSSEQSFGTITPRSSIDSRSMSPTNSNRSESPSPSSSTSGDRLSRRQASFIQASPTVNQGRSSLTVPHREYSGDFDMNDPKTADALDALKKQENLARRSSVRRASVLYRSTSGASTRGYARPRLGSDVKEYIPPVPMVPEQDRETASDSADGTIASTSLGNGQPDMHSFSDIGKGSGESNKNDIETGSIDLYLKHGRQVKKVEYHGVIEIPRLRILFIEKFPHIVRNDHFPAIYLFSPKAQTSYELENPSDVKADSVLTLEPEESPNVNNHVAEQMNAGFSTVAKEMSQVKQELLSYLKEVHEKSVTAANIKIEPSTPSPTTENTKETEKKATGAEAEIPKGLNDMTQGNISASVLSDVKEKLKQVESIRRDMGVVRQLHDSFRVEMQDLMGSLREKSKLLKAQPTTVTSARQVVNDSKEELDKTVEDITKRLEDLQDTIDELRLDVTSRKCRPSSTQMQHCEQEVKKLQNDIAKLSDKIQTIEPTWKFTWEEELQNIVEEGQFIKDQKALLSDLKADHTAILEVFGQLQKIREIQEKNRPARREFRLPPSEAGYDGMNSVLKQVTTIDIDPERRLRALNQAEKMRERELANRIDEFEHELTSFVESKKLRMTGGAQEIERQRQKKNQNMLRQLYEQKKEKGKDGDNDANEQGEVQENLESDQANDVEFTGDAAEEGSTDPAPGTPLSEESASVEATSQNAEAQQSDSQSAIEQNHQTSPNSEPDAKTVIEDIPAQTASSESPIDDTNDGGKDIQ